MKLTVLTVSLVVAVLFTASCGATKVNLASKGLVKSSSDILKIEGNWIKDKGKKFDLSVKMTNLTNKELLVMRGDMICKKGEHVGSYGSIGRVHTNIASNRPLFLTFEPGEVQQFYITCILDPNVEYKDKDFYFVVKTVYENLSKSPTAPEKGTKLAKDIELQIKLN